MWWLIGTAPSGGRGLGFESGITHNDSDALQDHCVIQCRKTQNREGNLPLRIERETYP